MKDEQVWKTNTDRSISEKAVLKALDDWIHSTNDLDNLIENIKAIPSAESCENCCNGDQEEKAKLCQKSYLAGMEHNFKGMTNGQTMKALQADEEYISKSDMIDWLKDIRSRINPQGFHTASEFEIAENQILYLMLMLQTGALPTVAIPSAEPCEDAISRQAVLDVVSNPLNIRLEEIIKKLPPVKPQPICEEREKGECPYYAG